MDSLAEQRSKAYRRLAGSGLVLLILFGVYSLSLKVLKSGSQRELSVESGESSTLPVLHTLGSLSLTNHLGEAIGLDAFRGSPWFANIIFTRCPGPCARMTKQMQTLQSKLSTEQQAKFVSISTDPEFDTPEVLTQYARKFHADTSSWSFLTGTKEEIFRVSTEELLLVLLEKDESERESPNDIFLHSTLTVLVDPLGRIRGSYEMLEEGELEQAIEDLRLLESEVF
jgi:protein SCO1/2